MTAARPRIFISYARKDGETLAEDLEKRLITVFGDGIAWRDRTGIDGDRAWWLQIEAAIKDAEFFLLIATPAALQSPIVIKEWRTARKWGTCVYAVLHPDAALKPDFKTLPQWQQKAQFFDITTQERWDIVLNHLKHPCDDHPIPMMAPSLPETFIARPDISEPLKTALLSSDRVNPVAITITLRGAGGFGKTAMAAALCHDDMIQTAFDDGILWVTLGTQPDVMGELRKLYEAITNQEADFSASLSEGGRALADALSERDCLIVIDDAWNYADVAPFLMTTETGGKRCARLITTRDGGIAVHAKSRATIEVDEMTGVQSAALLGAGLETLAANGWKRIGEIAERLGNWAQMLEIANYMLRERIYLTEATVDEAAEWLWQLLKIEGILVLQNDNNDGRRRNIDDLIGVSLRTLPTAEVERAYELAVFRDDLDLPLMALAALWGVGETAAEMKALGLAKRSLARYSSSTGTMRLHDNIREYFASKLRDAKAVHERLLAAWGDIYALPNAFAWRWIGYHLIAAERADDCRTLLFDFLWLKAKLESLDTAALVADCDLLLARCDDGEIRLLRSVLALSAPALAVDRMQLPIQLHGRLFSHKDKPTIASLLVTTIYSPGMLHSINPNAPTHESAGGALLAKFEGHTGRVSGALALDDGTLVSWSDDNTLCRWSQEGERLATFAGHTGEVTGALALDDGTLLSWSNDDTLRRWSRAGEPLATYEGHTGGVIGALAVDDGTLLSWSGGLGSDNTLRRWSRAGEPLATYEGHTDGVIGALALGAGTFLSWSWDATLRRWGQDGGLMATLVGHKVSVYGVLALDDGTFLSWSADNTLRRWSCDGMPIAMFEGHADAVDGVLALEDGTFLSWSTDNTLRRWSQMGEWLATFEGHTGDINGALALDDGTLVSWSGDKTLRRWSRDGTLLATFEGHTAWVNGALALDDGTLLSWSGDKTLRRWSRDGTLLATFEGHTAWVNGALALDNETFVSWSADNTLRRWSRDGTSLATLEGHTVGDWGALALDDGTLVSWGNKMLRRWSHDGTPLVTFGEHRGDINGVLALNDGTLLSWSGGFLSDITLRRWSREGTPLATFEGHKGNINGALALDDTTLLSWSGGFASDNTVRRWAVDGAPLATLKGHTDGVDGVLELDDSTLLSWSNDATLRRWSRAGEEIATFEGHTDGVVGAVRLDDGTILSWSRDDTLRHWSRTGERLATFEGHTDRVNGALQLDDGTLLSWSRDETLRRWRRDGTGLATFEGHRGGIMGALALDDGTLLSWSVDNTLRRWSRDGTALYITLEHIMGGRDVSSSLRRFSLTDGTLIWMTQNWLKRCLSDGTILSRFHGDALFSILLVHPDGETITAGDDAGRVLSLRVAE